MENNKSLFLAHIGQSSGTWPHLTAREAGKYSLALWRKEDIEKHLVRPKGMDHSTGKFCRETKRYVLGDRGYRAKEDGREEVETLSKEIVDPWV